MTSRLAIACLVALLVGNVVEPEGPLPPQAPESFVHQPPPRRAPGEYGSVAYIHLEGMIDRHLAGYLDRALREARNQGVDTVLVHIDTDGGLVDAGRRMMKSALDAATLHNLHTVAFVDFRAISAGAMIAYGHREIHITPTATIGNIGVIFQDAEGGIRYAPEKVETIVRALLQQAHDNNGWNAALLQKMTARNQHLYEYRLPDGRRYYVIGDDVERFEADHSEIDPEDRSQKVLRLGEDRLLTYTGIEALQDGMATAVVNDLDTFYADNLIDPDEVIPLLMTSNERVARSLAMWAPLLAGLALLFIILEFKTPGVGIFAILAAVSGGLFLICQYYGQMVGYIEVILITIGLVLIVIELLTVFSGGLLGLAGGAMAAAGLVLAFMGQEFQFDPGSELFLPALMAAIRRAFLALAIMLIGGLAALWALPNSRLGNRLSVPATIAGTAPGSDGHQDIIGSSATTLTMLRPGGTIRYGDHSMSATAEHGQFIAAGCPVTIIAYRFGEALVRPAEAAITADTQAENNP